MTTDCRFSNFDFFLQIGLKGEELKLHSLSGSTSVEWGQASQNQPLAWYKVMTVHFGYCSWSMTTYSESLQFTLRKKRIYNQK